MNSLLITYLLVNIETIEGKPAWSLRPNLHKKVWLHLINITVRVECKWGKPEITIVDIDRSEILKEFWQKTASKI